MKRASDAYNAVKDVYTLNHEGIYTPHRIGLMYTIHEYTVYRVMHELVSICVLKRYSYRRPDGTKKKTRAYVIDRGFHYFETGYPKHWLLEEKSNDG